MPPHIKLIGVGNFHSPVTALTGGAATIEVAVDDEYSHSFAGVRYFSDAEGTTPATPTAGTETYSVKTSVQPDAFQPFVGNVINSADTDQTNWAANISAVKVVIASVDVATHVQVLVSANIS